MSNPAQVKDVEFCLPNAFDADVRFDPAKGVLTITPKFRGRSPLVIAGITTRDEQGEEITAYSLQVFGKAGKTPAGSISVRRISDDDESPGAEDAAPPAAVEPAATTEPAPAGDKAGKSGGKAEERVRADATT